MFTQLPFNWVVYFYMVIFDEKIFLVVSEFIKN